MNTFKQYAPDQEGELFQIITIEAKSVKVEVLEIE